MVGPQGGPPLAYSIAPFLRKKNFLHAQKFSTPVWPRLVAGRERLAFVSRDDLPFRKIGDNGFVYAKHLATLLPQIQRLHVLLKRDPLL